MHFEKARNRRVIHPANHQKHSASLSCTDTRFAHREKCSHLPDTNYAPPPMLLSNQLCIILRCHLKSGMLFEAPQRDGQDHKAEQ